MIAEAHDGTIDLRGEVATLRAALPGSPTGCRAGRRPSAPTRLEGPPEGPGPPRTTTCASPWPPVRPRRPTSTGSCCASPSPCRARAPSGWTMPPCSPPAAPAGSASAPGPRPGRSTATGGTAGPTPGPSPWTRPTATPGCSPSPTPPRPGHAPLGEPGRFRSELVAALADRTGAGGLVLGFVGGARCLSVIDLAADVPGGTWPADAPGPGPAGRAVGDLPPRRDHRRAGHRRGVRGPAGGRRARPPDPARGLGRGAGRGPGRPGARPPAPRLVLLVLPLHQGHRGRRPSGPGLGRHGRRRRAHRLRDDRRRPPGAPSATGWPPTRSSRPGWPPWPPTSGPRGATPASGSPRSSSTPTATWPAPTPSGCCGTRQGAPVTALWNQLWNLRHRQQVLDCTRPEVLAHLTEVARTLRHGLGLPDPQARLLLRRRPARGAPRTPAAPGPRPCGPGSTPSGRGAATTPCSIGCGLPLGPAVGWSTPCGSAPTWLPPGADA